MLDTLSEDIRHALEFAGKSGSPSTFCRTTPGTTVLDGSRRLTHPTPVTAASRSSSTRSSRIRAQEGPSDGTRSAVGPAYFSVALRVTAGPL
jgi:hypothetical protein